MTAATRSLFTRRTLLIAFAQVAVFVALLYLIGRPSWCKQGPGIWSPAPARCTSQHVFDPYTLSHVLHGVIFFWLLWPLAGKISLSGRLVAALVLEIGWELLENSPWIIQLYRDHTASFDYAGDSVINSLADVLVSILGFAIASRFSWKVSLALFIALELWALYLARDNLTLNVLMFLFPIEAVKQWQLGA
jgi:hypothetical protein